MSRSLDIWMAAAEAAPLAHVGGLGDVLRALPPALARRGHRVTRFLPAYGQIPREGFVQEEDGLAVPFGWTRQPVRFLSRRDPDGVTTTLVVCDELFGRDGIYGPPEGEFDDNARRFVLLTRAVRERARRRAAGPPDILHLHDWHTALAPLMARATPGGHAAPRTVLTIHNIGYQGKFPLEEADWLGLDDDALARALVSDVLEDHGELNFLKAGLALADRIVAVSPTYAREIATPEGGFGLDPYVRRRGDHVTGILNGADYDVWNPAADLHLPRPYSAESLGAKAEAAAALRRAVGLPPSGLDGARGEAARGEAARGGRPILGVVSRLSSQKGIDLVLEAAPALLALGADLVVLGAGDGTLAAGLQEIRDARPDRVGLHLGFDAPLSHLVVAGSDLLLMPSRYEPCGLTQMHALRYGTIPVARRTGGLADTIRDETRAPDRGTGFLFDEPSSAALAETVGRALKLRWTPGGWNELQRRAMAENFGWDNAAAVYAALYLAID